MLWRQPQHQDSSLRNSNTAVSPWLPSTNNVSHTATLNRSTGTNSSNSSNTNSMRTNNSSNANSMRTNNSSSNASNMEAAWPTEWEAEQEEEWACRVQAWVVG